MIFEYRKNKSFLTEFLLLAFLIEINSLNIAYF